MMLQAVILNRKPLHGLHTSFIQAYSIHV
jgi:hypothetical protein